MRQSIANWQHRWGRMSSIAWVLAGQALQSLTSFLTVAAVGRWAGASELGIFALAVSCFFLAASVIDTLVATPYTYLHAHTDSPAQADLGLAALAAAMLVGVLVALPLTVLWWLDWTALAKLWPLLPCVAALTMLREFVRRHFLLTRAYAAILVTDAMLALCQLSVVGLLAWTGKLSAWSATAAMGLAAVASLLLSLRYLSWQERSAQRALRRFPTFARSSIQYGYWLFLGGLCHVASVQLYPWLATANGGVRQAGLYAACLSVINLVNPLLIGLTNYFRPRFMQALGSGSKALSTPVDLPAFVRYVAQRALVFALPALVIALALTVAGHWALGLLYGPAFVEARGALGWMGWGAFAVALAAPVQLALLALRAPSTNFFYHGCNLLLLLLGAAWFWGHLGVLQLGQIYGVSNALGALLLTGLLWRRLREHGTAGLQPERSAGS